jgi:hypothetical protein
MLDESSAHRVLPDIFAGRLKAIAFTLFLPEQMIMGLFLPGGREVFSKKLSGTLLIGAFLAADQDKMQMIRHEPVGGAGQPMAATHMG